MVTLWFGAVKHLFIGPLITWIRHLLTLDTELNCQNGEYLFLDVPAPSFSAK